MFAFILQQLLNGENVKFYTDVLLLEIGKGTNIGDSMKKVAFDVLKYFFYLFMYLVSLSSMFHKTDSESGNMPPWLSPKGLSCDTHRQH